MEPDQHDTGSQAAQSAQPQGYDYSAYYHYYQQNPEAWAQHVMQWQQYQQANANPAPYLAYPYQDAYQGMRNNAYPMGVEQIGYGHADRQERAVPSTTLWVGNLPWDCMEQDIRSVFEIFGRIRSIRILGNKNCAFVTYYDLDASTAAHYGTFGLTIKNSLVKVGWGKALPNDFVMRVSNPREDNVQPSSNIWVGQLDSGISEDELRAAFRQFGVIERIRVLPARNCAFINFAHLESAVEAKERMNGALIRDQPIRVNYGKQREERADRSSPTFGGGRFPVGPSNHPTWSNNSDGIGRNEMDMRYDGGGGGMHSGSGGRTQPPPTPPPSDTKDVIDKLVDNIIRKGRELEMMVREKQATNPRFAFLRDGLGSHYYHWKLDMARRSAHYVDPAHAPAPPHPEMIHQNIPSNQYASMHSPAKSDASPSAIPPWEQPDLEPDTLPSPPTRLSPNEEEDLLSILSGLSQTREKIESAAEWVTRHRDRMSSISVCFKNYLLQRTESLASCINILYVINESLQTGLKTLRVAADATPGNTDKISSGFLPHLNDMIRHIKVTYGEDAGKINDILAMWKDKGIYSPAVIDSWIFSASPATLPTEDFINQKPTFAPPPSNSIPPPPPETAPKEQPRVPMSAVDHIDEETLAEYEPKLKKRGFE